MSQNQDWKGQDDDRLLAFRAPNVRTTPTNITCRIDDQYIDHPKQGGGGCWKGSVVCYSLMLFRGVGGNAHVILFCKDYSTTCDDMSMIGSLYSRGCIDKTYHINTYKKLWGCFHLNGAGLTANVPFKQGIQFMAISSANSLAMSQIHFRSVSPALTEAPWFERCGFGVLKPTFLSLSGDFLMIFS